MVEVHGELNPLESGQWGRLFPGAGNPDGLIECLRDAIAREMTFHSIVVRHRGRPILLMPLCVFPSPRASVLIGNAMRELKRFFSFAPKPSGLAELTRGFIGYERDVDEAVLAQAAEYALAVKKSLAGRMNLCLAMELAALVATEPARTLENLAVS